MILALGGALGVIAQFLFYAVPLGVNLPLMVTALLAAAWAVRSPTARFHPLDAWLPAVALVLASFVAVRSDPPLAVVDTFGALVLTGAAMAAIAGEPILRRRFRDVVALAGRFIGSATVSAAPALSAVTAAYQPLTTARRASGPAGAIGRGLAIAAPIVLVFAVLFAAADAVFARMLGNLFSTPVDIGELAGRTTYAAVGTWVCAGVLVFVAVLAGRASRTESDTGAGAGQPSRWRLGTTESVVVLVSVDLLFAVFVAIQGTYLFGGRETLDASGLTYSAYARRGFFELVAVAILAGVLLVSLDSVVRERSRSYVVAALGLCALTGAVLASSLMRLLLYQQAYGWTELRFYVLAAIVWLALGVVLTAVALVRCQMAWLLNALAVAAVAVTLFVNVIGPQSFIARQNIARALDESLVPPDGFSGLDELYLAGLGDEAVPVVLEALPQLGRDDRARLARSLAVRLAILDRDEGSRSWQAWNLGRERARAALDAARNELPEVRVRHVDGELWVDGGK